MMKLYLIIITVLFTVEVLFTSCQNDKNTSKVESRKEKENITKDSKTALKVTDTYSVDGINFQLMQDKDKAEIKITAKDRVIAGNIKLSPPCYFLKRWDKVQSFSYPDVGVEHTLIILGDTVGTERKKYFGVIEDTSSNKICGEAIQGILIKKDSVIITKRVMDGGFACKDSGRDEKDYWDFAHRRETIKDAQNHKYR